MIKMYARALLVGSVSLPARFCFYFCKALTACRASMRTLMRSKSISMASVLAHLRHLW